MPLDFALALNKCRIGQLDGPTTSFFRSLERPIDPNFFPHVDPIYLFPTRREVHNMNRARLDQLDSMMFTFMAVDDLSGCSDKAVFKEFPVDTRVCLKIGAQVMLLQNLGDGLANGSTGRIVGFFRPGQVDRHHVGRKAGLLRNIKVDANDYPLECVISSRAELRDTRDLYPLVRFTTGEESEYVLVMPIEFSFKIKDKVVARRIQVRYVNPLCIIAQYQCT